MAGSIVHDKVQPFAQPVPATVSETVAITFKPRLKGTGSPGGGCKGSHLGSQIYGRAAWHKGLWAIIYAWYFPKDRPSWLFTEGQRHDWANVVVWLDNPAVENPAMIGVSPSSINYLEDGNNHGLHTVDITWKSGGEFQDLIMWEQLTDAARVALNNTDFGGRAKVPFNDADFNLNLQNAWLYKMCSF
ncbi:hypothetical protein F444_16645 [Phytophthora nicotianae P1976]|uniref:Necrosis inducing protein NPP1 n=1 Tax=Phytophthora nicotianae P1976 TaxID=1317066 RepID=A0A080ZHI8_PHYNI|nr:hypothetical protein F444_16645 [Phytophthora nicotianae P1976]